jgi:hypothetical protein
MNVRADRRHRHECPDWASCYIQGDGADIIIGDHYDVHAVVVFDGIVFYLIVGVSGHPQWLPAILFSFSTLSVADDWIYTIVDTIGFHGVSLIAGPEFIAKDIASYTAMVEMDPVQVDRFWKRVASRSHPNE